MSADNLIREIPESWQKSELGKVAKWGSGGTPKSGTSAFYGGGIPWAVIGDLTETWVSETAQTITQAGLENSSAKIVEPGTVMLAMYGASIGRTGIASVKLATNQAIAFAVPINGVIDNQFLLKYLQSQKEAFVRAGQGGAQPNISQTVIKPWPIPVPPIEEQKKIVEILEEQLSRLDAALTSVRAVREKAARFKRSLLHAAFTGAPFAGEVSLSGPTSDWKIEKLGRHIEIIMGQAPPGSTCNKDGIGTPFVKVGEFGASRPVIREWTTKPLRMAQANDVLLCVVGATCGKVNRGVECAIGRSVAALRPMGTLNTEFLFQFMYFKTMEMRASSRGSAQGVISKKDLSDLLLPVPPLSRQMKIVEILEEQFSRVDASLVIADEVEKKASSLRRSLLHAAFTGNLTEEWRENNHV